MNKYSNIYYIDEDTPGLFKLYANGKSGDDWTFATWNGKEQAEQAAVATFGPQIIAQLEQEYTDLKLDFFEADSLRATFEDENIKLKEQIRYLTLPITNEEVVEFTKMKHHPDGISNPWYPGRREFANDVIANRVINIQKGNNGLSK